MRFAPMIGRTLPAWCARTPTATLSSPTILPRGPHSENSLCLPDHCEPQMLPSVAPVPVRVQKNLPQAEANTRFPAPPPARPSHEHPESHRPLRATASSETRAGVSQRLPMAYPTFRGPNSQKPSLPVEVHRLHSRLFRVPRPILFPLSATDRAKYVCTAAVARWCSPHIPCPRQRSHPNPSRSLPWAFRLRSEERRVGK